MGKTIMYSNFDNFEILDYFVTSQTPKKGSNSPQIGKIETFKTDLNHHIMTVWVSKFV